MSWGRPKKVRNGSRPSPPAGAIVILALVIGVSGFSLLSAADGQVRIHIDPQVPEGISPDGQRIYVVTETDGIITAPRLRIKAENLPALKKVYLSCLFIPGPHRNPTKLSRTPFIISPSFRGKLINNHTCYLTTGPRGTIEVEFRCEPYAGDRYILSLSRGLPPRVYRYPDRRQHRILKREALASRVFSVWKILYLEPVKVIRGVRFPRSVLQRLADNLSGMNIECRYAPDPVIIDPREKNLALFFSSGDAADPSAPVLRYGPRMGVDMDFLMEMINRRFSDQRPHTLNIIIFGFQSPDSDLIRNSVTGLSQEYGENVPRELIDYAELHFNSQAVYADQVGGQSPVIFCWSDFFYRVAQLWRVEHAALLARALLHEIGHYMMRHSRPRSEELSGFDPHGHLREETAAEDPFIMSGISRIPARERKFLKNLQWHPLTQRIIRRSFILKPPDGNNRKKQQQAIAAGR
jgi:hypothetical protein